MIRSTLSNSTTVDHGLHLGLIMDGNGRWATARGRPRIAGHRAGADNVRDVVATSTELGVTVLTLYAFSSDNFNRSREEVDALMRLFRAFLRTESAALEREGIRLCVVGRRDRLKRGVLGAIEDAEERTCRGAVMRLRVAIDYSSTASILEAASHLRAGPRPTRADFRVALAAAINDPLPVTDVDLLIRTGGERRLSDFLLWESAYAELFFTDTPWPEFGATELENIVTEFRRRDRRFGGIGGEAATQPKRWPARDRMKHDGAVGGDNGRPSTVIPFNERS